jgi:hypothetical protein
VEGQDGSDRPLYRVVEGDQAVDTMTQSILLELPAELRDRILRELLICLNVIYRTTDLKNHNIYPEILYTNK